MKKTDKENTGTKQKILFDISNMDKFMYWHINTNIQLKRFKDRRTEQNTKINDRN